MLQAPSSKRLVFRLFLGFALALWALALLQKKLNPDTIAVGEFEESYVNALKPAFVVLTEYSYPKSSDKGEDGRVVHVVQPQVTLDQKKITWGYSDNTCCQFSSINNVMHSMGLTRVRFPEEELNSNLLDSTIVFTSQPNQIIAEAPKAMMGKQLVHALNSELPFSSKNNCSLVVEMAEHIRSLCGDNITDQFVQLPVTLNSVEDCLSFLNEVVLPENFQLIFASCPLRENTRTFGVRPSPAAACSTMPFPSSAQLKPRSVKEEVRVLAFVASTVPFISFVENGAVRNPSTGQWVLFEDWFREEGPPPYCTVKTLGSKLRAASYNLLRYLSTIVKPYKGSFRIIALNFDITEQCSPIFTNFIFAPMLNPPGKDSVRLHFEGLIEEAMRVVFSLHQHGQIREFDMWQLSYVEWDDGDCLPIE